MQKQNIINFLKSRTTTFSVDEVNALINAINELPEPEVKESKKK